MTTATPRPPDLTRARTHVRGVMAAAGGPPTVQAVFPLTFLDAALETKLAQRFAAGLTDPRDFPRRGALRRNVIPSAALAVLDAIALMAAIATGRTVLLVVAAVLLVIFTVIAAGGLRFVGDDTLRLTPAERRAVQDARTWRSDADWSGAASGACGLVVAAADAAARICRTPFWRVGQIHDVQVQLDLSRELDAIDVAARRPDLTLDPLVDRVAALTAYADQVDGYERRRAATASGGVEHDFGTDDHEVVALLGYLNATVPRR